MRTEQDDRVFVYTLDKDDRIVTVSNNCLSFAQENGVPEIRRDTVVGNVIWELFSDRHTVLIHQLIVAKVRAKHRPISWTFRCDSADWFRVSECQALPIDDNGIKYENRFSAQYPRTPISILDPMVSRSQEFVTLCSWCKGVIQRNRVLTLEYMNELLTHSPANVLPQIRHGMCEDCYTHQRQAIRSQ